MRRANIVTQDIPQPAEQFLDVLSAESWQIPLGFQKRQLHQIGRVEPSAEPVVQITLSQDHQVRAIIFQQPTQRLAIARERFNEKLLVISAVHAF
jgi:hypothetical protein